MPQQRRLETARVNAIFQECGHVTGLTRRSDEEEAATGCVANLSFRIDGDVAEQYRHEVTGMVAELSDGFRSDQSEMTLTDLMADRHGVEWAAGDAWAPIFLLALGIHFGLMQQIVRDGRSYLTAVL